MRNRATPVNNTARKRRRAPGLRREEVALRAGISVTWYTWLEQGRPVRVSRQTIEAIGRALDLDSVHRSHLDQLAELLDNSSQAEVISSVAEPSVRQLVDGLAPHAAYAINGLWDVLHANEAAITLLGQFNAHSATTNNVLRRLFLDEHWRECFEHWPDVAESAVAQFRAATAARVGHPQFPQFVSQLCHDSSEFAALWARHDLATAAAKEKIFAHPVRGRIRLWYSSLTPDGTAPDVRVVLYLPIE